MRLYQNPPGSVVTFAGNPVRTVDATIFRYFDKGILLREADGPIVFRQWASTDRIETPIADHFYQGVLCGKFGVACVGPGQPVTHVTVPPRVAPANTTTTGTRNGSAHAPGR